MKKRSQQIDVLEIEAKSIVLHSFRNGPIENVHTGSACPTCAGKSKYSHITDAEMKRIMKHAVDWVYTLLWLRLHAPEEYTVFLHRGMLYTGAWDKPKLVRMPKKLISVARRTVL
jgi:hypothetical protein